MTYQCEHCGYIMDEEEVIGVGFPVYGNGVTEPPVWMCDDYLYYCPMCDSCIQLEEYEL